VKCESKGNAGAGKQPGRLVVSPTKRGTLSMDLEQMKQKYASVLKTVQQEQVELKHVHIQDDKLFIEGVAPSEQAKNKVWDRIKQVNPRWEQELVANISVDPSANPSVAQGASSSGRSYTVQLGDSLSKISKQFYGDGNKYTKIFEANRDILSDPNKINPGQTLKIPA
jgi:nucleoid-associated protein YgaU